MLQINVLIVTYKQESVIARAINSVLDQIDFGLNNIIIIDDASPDHTWEIVSQFSHNYPEIIKSFRNENNLGVYGNFNKLISYRGDADLFYILSGDDKLLPNYFKTIQEYIYVNNIDVKNSACAFYSDWERINPQGDVFIYKQNKILRGNAFSLKIRNIICGRSVLISKEVIRQYSPVDTTKGLSYAEELFDTQKQRYSDINYYCPFIGSIYYSGIGISKELGKEYLYQDITKWQLMMDNLVLDEKDIEYAKYKIQFAQFHQSPSFTKYCSMLMHYCKSIHIEYGISPLKFAKNWCKLLLKLFL